MRADVALLVADDRVLRALWQQLLHVHDGRWHYVHSPGGHEALRALELHDPALVITDAAIVEVAGLVRQAVGRSHRALVVLAGDNPAVRGLDLEDVARLSRVASGTVELTDLVRTRVAERVESGKIRA